MAAKICDGACKCTECVHYKKDSDRGGKSCFAKPDSFGIVRAQKKKNK